MRYVYIIRYRDNCIIYSIYIIRYGKIDIYNRNILFLKNISQNIWNIKNKYIFLQCEKENRNIINKNIKRYEKV